MGIYRGLGVVNDGLVFGYDTGYPISDPGVATRFNQGKPTTNLQVNGVAAGHNSGNYGNVVTVADAPEKGPRWKKVTISNRGSNFRILKWTYTSHDSNVLYSHSAEFDWGNMRDEGYTIVFDGNGGGTRKYFRNGDYSTDGGSTINAALENGHFASNITKSGTHTHAWFIYNQTTGVSGLNDYFYYRDYQVEREPESSPFVSGARSDTASLIDLKRTASIDVGDVSFDSNAQLVFDGTDDYITMANNPQVGDTQASWEFVVKFDITHNDDTSTYRQLYIQESSVWIAQYYDKIGIDIRKDNGSWFDGNGGIVTSSQTAVVDANIWYHVVFTFNNGVIKGYLNNVLQFTTTVSGMTSGIANGSTPRRIGRRTNQPLDGSMPVVRLYNTDLTALQVAQNFNAYKNRFNI